MVKQTRIIIHVIHVKNKFDQANIWQQYTEYWQKSQTTWTMCIISPSTTHSLFFNEVKIMQSIIKRGNNLS